MDIMPQIFLSVGLGFVLGLPVALLINYIYDKRDGAEEEEAPEDGDDVEKT